MSYYTEFHFNARMRDDVPQEILDRLDFMTNDNAVQTETDLPDHPLFSCTRWRYMLCDGSASFDAQPNSELVSAYGNTYLCIRCNLKNYDSEIEKFVDWVAPYLDKRPGNFLGFRRYEGIEEPEPIYMPGHDPLAKCERS